MTAAAATTASTLLEALRSTLQSEQSALVRGEADALPALADAKAQAFDQISRAMRGASLSCRRCGCCTNPAAAVTGWS